MAARKTAARKRPAAGVGGSQAGAPEDGSQEDGGPQAGTSEDRSQEDRSPEAGTSEDRRQEVGGSQAGPEEDRNSEEDGRTQAGPQEGHGSQEDGGSQAGAQEVDQAGRRGQEGRSDPEARNAEGGGHPQEDDRSQEERSEEALIASSSHLEGGGDAPFPIPPSLLSKDPLLGSRRAVGAHPDDLASRNPRIDRHGHTERARAARGRGRGCPVAARLPALACEPVVPSPRRPGDRRRSRRGVAGAARRSLGPRRVLRNERPLGAVRAVRAALDRPMAKGADFILIVEPSASLDRDAVGRLVEAAVGIGVEDVGVVGAKIVDKDDPRSLRDIGRSSDRFGHPASALQPGEIDQGQFDRVLEVLCVSSSAMLIAREAWERVGMWDERLDRACRSRPLLADTGRRIPSGDDAAGSRARCRNGGGNTR